MRKGTKKVTVFVTKRARSFGVRRTVEGKDSKRDENGNTIGLWGSPFARGVATVWSLRGAKLATAPFLDPVLVPFYPAKKDRRNVTDALANSLDPTPAQAWRTPHLDALRFPYRRRPPKETIPTFLTFLFLFIFLYNLSYLLLIRKRRLRMNY